MIGSMLTLLLQSFYLRLRLTGRSGSFPRPLTPEEEKKAIEEMCAGDLNAREKLILHNLRLVAHVIKKYYTNSSDQDDLISIGTIGLVKAIDSYKTDKNVKLPTYACKCIQNELFMHFRNVKKRASDLSLSDPLDNEGEGPLLSVMDVLQTDDDTQERMELSETYALLGCLVDSMQDMRQKQIVRMRYGFSGRTPLTQREVAEKLGISRSYVSRIEKKALEDLETQLRASLP